MKQPTLAVAATDKMNSESSAVAKVFALPELVEHILFCLASDKLQAKARYRVVDDIQPLKCLAAVQRVDTNFRSNIKSSKKLQRLMATPLVSTYRHCPHEAKLFDKAVRLHLGEQDNWVVAMQEIDTSTKKGLRMFETLMSNKEASWRSVKIRKDSMGPSVFVFCPTVRQLSEGFFDSRAWELACDATLGMLFDLYCEIMLPVYEKDRRMGNATALDSK